LEGGEQTTEIIDFSLSFFLSYFIFQSDAKAGFLRSARDGHLDKVLDHLKNNTDINTSNAVNISNSTFSFYQTFLILCVDFSLSL
jgi:hypothetical protein